MTLPPRSRWRLFGVTLPFLAPVLSTPAHAQEAATAERASQASAEARLTARLDALAEFALDDDSPALVAAVRRELAASLTAARDDVEAAAELEVLLAFAETAVDDAWYDGPWRRALTGIEVPRTPALATVRARVDRLRGDTSELAVLGAWSFVGPFDNERGRGMTRRTPAERNPGEGVAHDPSQGDDPYKGKVRDVRWRPTPEPGPDGNLYIGRLIHPAEQACVVARTWVRSDGERSARLLLSIGEEGRVWWNGDAVYESLGPHAFQHDAHTIAIELEDGWNELVLKVGSQDDWPYFGARIVDAESGAPLALEASATAPEGEAPEKLANPGRRLKSGRGVDAPGAMSFYATRDDEEARLARAILAQRAQAEARKSRPGLEEATAALEALPTSAAAALVQLWSLRVAGALDVEEDVNPWLAAIETALALHGDRSHLLRAWASHASDGQSLPRRALDLIERGLAANPKSVPLRWERIGRLSDLQQDALAERATRELADDPAFLRWPRLTYDMSGGFDGDDPRKMRMLEASAAAGYDYAGDEIASLRSLAARGSSAADAERALRASLDRDPWNVSARLWAGRRMLAVGEYERALAYLDEGLALCPEAPEFHSWRARVLLVMGDNEGAIDALERVVTYDVSAADEERLLEYLRTAKADGAIAGAFHDRFREPLEDVLARRADDPPPSDATAPREVLLNRLVVEVAPDGTARRYRRIVERVLTTAGARELDRRGFGAWPGAEEIRVLAADVRRADGSIERARTGRTGSRGRLTVDLPPLEPGDVVDLEWRHDDLRPSIFGDYFGLDASFVPDARLAVREAEVVILERPGVELDVHLAGESDVDVATADRELPDGVRERSWRAGGFEPPRPERWQPPANESSLRVQASTYASWEEFGRWWWSLIREEITTSPEMREKVAELVEGKESPLERLRAVYDFVVTDIRYNAWEFGVHGYRPYSAPVIFSRRFGDCKDKAILLRAMLGEVGIESWPVVIRSEGRRFEEDHALAMIGHFNHAIAYVPEQDGIPEMFLDGTARLHPLEVLPDSDRGARVVTVREDGVDPMRIPFPTAEENVMRESLVVDLRGEGARVRLVRRPEGRWDPRERYTFTGGDDERAEAVEQLLTARFGGLVGEPTAEHPDYEDLTQALEVVLEGTPERIGRDSGAGRELPTSFDTLDLTQGIASESERTTDLLLDVPWSTETEVVYELPPGARPRTLPEPVEVDLPDVGYTRTVEWQDSEGGPRVVVKERFELRTHRVPVERYDAFREAARAIDRAQDETVDVEVGQ